MDSFILDVAKRLDELDDPREINDVMDKLEFLYEALDSEQQDLVGQLMGKLESRLRSLV